MSELIVMTEVMQCRYNLPLLLYHWSQSANVICILLLCSTGLHFAIANARHYDLKLVVDCQIVLP